MVTDWMDEAACRGMDVDMWYNGVDQAAAVRICRSCPVQLECLEYAMSFETAWYSTRYGIYGGVTSRQRKRLHDARKQTIQVPS